MSKSLGEVMQDKAHGLYRCPACIGETKIDDEIETIPWMTLDQLHEHDRGHSTADLFGAAFALYALAD